MTKIQKRKRKLWRFLFWGGALGLVLIYVQSQRESEIPPKGALSETVDAGSYPSERAYEWSRPLEPFPNRTSQPLLKEDVPTDNLVAEEADVVRDGKWLRVTSSGAIARSFVTEDKKKAANQLNSLNLQYPTLPVRVMGMEEVTDFYWDGPVAPIGRLLRVELVNAIDSSVGRNPILGIVSHDLYWEGRLLIPAGTEVHGMATTEIARESLFAGNEWQLVFLNDSGGIPNGWVLPVTGVALERQDNTGEGKTFGWSDMRMGLPGTLMRADDYLEIKLFLSSFLGAAVSSLQSRRINAFSGTAVVEETAENAALSGLAKVLHEFSQGVLSEIERIGFYLRVRAGTQFYLMIQEPVDLNRGQLSGAKLEWSLRDNATTAEKRRIPDLETLQQLEEQLGFKWEELWKNRAYR